MIIQLGSILGALGSGIGQLGGALVQAALPSLVQTGQQFLVRELTRKDRRREKDRLKAQAIQALNSPGIAVTRVGGTTQPVGGRVQRSTFTPAALAPAQSPFGNIPLLPVSNPLGTVILPPFVMGSGPLSTPPVLTRQQPPISVGPIMPNALPGAPGEPRFATDQFGRTLMFAPSPRPGEGFLPVIQIRQLGLKPTKPFWRFNRLQGQFEKIKSRRMNPFNFKATKRAGRRIEATLDAVKEVVRIQSKMTRGKVTLRKRKKK